MRKYLYLITEHDNEDRIGTMSITDTPRTRPNKNEEAPLHTFNEGATDFEEVGKLVGAGFIDVQSEDAFRENAADIFDEKIRNIDEQWAKKAGVYETVYGDD